MSGSTTKERESYVIVSWLILRGIGFVYLCAFASLIPQILGLIGSHGISPAQDMLNQLQTVKLEACMRLPTVAWLNCSDTVLQLLPIIGCLFSLLVLAGIVTMPALIACWILYLSLVTIGGDFLLFQWDALLLETGFLAIFLAPIRLFEPPWKFGDKNAYVAKPPYVIIWLLRILLFRLVFASGMVKLLSGDANWRNLTALTYHYETQPLPNPPAWLANQLPLPLQKFSCLALFILELAAPLLIFTERKLRLIGFGLMVFLQILISFTGNYAYFNILAVVIAFSLLDDEAIKKLLATSKHSLLFASFEIRNTSKKQIIASYACLTLLLSLIACQAIKALDQYRIISDPAYRILDAVSPYHIFNSYGLFAIMTTSRPEIIVEGSNDGHRWEPYKFPFKPGDLNRPLPIVAPHQPRLDWQLWFAALGDYQSNTWFVNFMRRLLEGSPQVLQLVSENPFPKKPPKYVRAVIYDYHLTTFDQYFKTGNWWRRDNLRPYFPMASISEN